MTDATLARLGADVLRRDARNGIRRVLCDRATFTTDWLRWQPGRVFRGMDSCYVERTRRRYVAADTPLAPFTAGELARAWCREHANRWGVRWFSPVRSSEAFTMRAPGFFDPGPDRGGEWVMLDVVSAYWTLGSRLPVDSLFRVDGERGVRWFPGRFVFDAAELDDEREVRHAVFGLMQAAGLGWLVHGRRVSRSAPNPFAAAGPVGVTFASLHAMAVESVAAGAVAWLTDAAICRPDIAPKLTDLLENRWRVRVAVKACGAGELFGFGDYRIGEHETAGGHARRGRYSRLTRWPAGVRDDLAAIREAA